MNIRYRIILLVVLTFFAISLIGSLAVYQSRGSAIQVKIVTKGVVPSALATAELVGQLKDVQLSVMTIVSTADLKLAAMAEERLQATQVGGFERSAWQRGSQVIGQDSCYIFRTFFDR